MVTLLEKIEADAVEKLAYSPDRAPKAAIARYSRFLKVQSQRIKMAHRAGAGGLQTCNARAGLIDIIIRRLWEDSKAGCSEQAQKEFPPMAVVAIGGYGRGELNPHSDIDFMFLHDRQVVASGKPLPLLQKVIDGVLYPLWDLGLKIGYAIRTIPECVDQANQNMQSKTALIEARLITGDVKSFERLQKTIFTKCVLGREDAYIESRIRDQIERREKFGSSPTMQEPNIKNGCGGLRNYQNLLWMTHFKYQTRSLAELEHRELISASEHRHLRQAYDFLLSVRSELHYQVNRPVDILSKSLQPAIATRFGCTDRSPRKRLERFMQKFYTHTRHIYLITRTIEERLALLPKKTRLPSLRRLIRSPFAQEQSLPTVDGLRFGEDHIRATSSRIFKDQPRRLIRVFLHSQQRGLKLHPDLVQLIRSHLPLVDRAFLADPHVQATFLEILNQRGSVAPILRAMHEVEFLGKFLPEFGRLTCLVQHEFYHQYTTDEHTLVCIEQLDRIVDARTPPAENYTDILQEVERPFVLYLALLLHDAGKARPGNHSEIGGRIATRVARRLGLDTATAASLRLLIENHLTMARISQRRDLEDESVIGEFASLMENEEHLRMLTLHTFADSLGTSDKLWNGFKDSLLRQLYHKTLDTMRGGTAFIRAEEKHRELMATEVGGLLPSSFSPEEVDAHFETLPPRYFQVHSAQEVAHDLTLAHRFMHQQMSEAEEALAPILTWHNEPDRGYTSCKLCTWDRSGLFSIVAGSFAAAGINILNARIFTRADGIVLDTFLVSDATSGKLVAGRERDKLESLLHDALTGKPADFHQLIAKQDGKNQYASIGEDRIKTRIHFDNKTSDDLTLIEVETEDRLGLLFLISEVFHQLRIHLFLARISTEKGGAIDTFYVSGPDRQKITSQDQQLAIKLRLVQALDGE